MKNSTEQPEPACRVIIVGAGLAGSLLACYLGREGYEVEVHERRADPRKQGFIGGRSINLAVSCRAITALDQVGLAETILENAIPMRGRMMHDRDGRLIFQPYSKNPDEAIKSISRGGLNLALIDAADALANVTFHFDHKCEDIDLDLPAATFALADSGELVIRECDLIIGADGAFSTVRGRMLKLDRFSCSQSYLSHGYKELTIPPTGEGDFAMEPNALHIWPRGGFMMIALPNRDKTFTCTCFWPFEGPTGFEAISSEQDVTPFFTRHFPDAVSLMPTLVEDFMSNPLGSLATVRCEPWHYQDKVVLIGDAAHAVVPFYGQGINAGFEDCRILDACLRQHPSDRAGALRQFTAQRKINTDAIADLALANFIEMRDKVGSPAFLMKKKLEKTLHAFFPKWFMPLYNMISFSDIPYAEARAKAEAQWKTIKLVAGIGAILILIVIVFAFIQLT